MRALGDAPGGQDRRGLTRWPPTAASCWICTTTPLHSYDAQNRLRDYERAHAEGRIDVVAITDHDTISGALELREAAGFTVIVGEEIDTADGELIGLFLDEPVPAGLPGRCRRPRRIRAQGGLVYLQHPFYGIVRGRMRPAAREDLRGRGLIDIVEARNGGPLAAADNARALQWARACGLPHAASSGCARARGNRHLRLGGAGRCGERSLAAGAAAGGHDDRPPRAGPRGAGAQCRRPDGNGAAGAGPPRDRPDGAGPSAPSRRIRRSADYFGLVRSRVQCETAVAHRRRAAGWHFHQDPVLPFVQLQRARTAGESSEGCQ